MSSRCSGLAQQRYRHTAGLWVAGSTGGARRVKTPAKTLATNTHHRGPCPDLILAHTTSDKVSPCC